MQRTSSKRDFSTRIIIWLPPIVTLAISPSANYDPINPIKVLSLSTITFFAFGTLLYDIKRKIITLNKLSLYGTLLFVFFLFTSLIFSGAPISQQIWGSFGRNTGLLTYLSLSILLLFCSAYSSAENIKSIIKSLVLTSIVITIYCFIQIAKLDPIGWSSKDTFATLGNINFLSAFLGLSTVAITSIVFFSKMSLKSKLSIGILGAVQLGIILSTGSIQGFMMWVAGLAINLFLFLRSTSFYKYLFGPYILLSFISLYLTIIGLTDKGPLAKFLYQPSVLFRADYMHAGWAMTLLKPFTGVGLDSYGDWYRQVRGEISTNRTGPDRIANTAHNIFLDISSNGGFPLLFAYLILVTSVLVLSFTYLKKNRRPDFSFIALFVGWCTYQVQSLISINQVGVGVWGWAFTGLLLYSLRDYKKESSSVENLSGDRKVRRKVTNRNRSTISPNQIILGVTFGAVGFILSLMPLQADASFKSALQKGDLTGLMKASDMTAATSFHGEMTLELALKNNFGEQAKIISQNLITRFPRDFMAWRATRLLSNNPVEVREQALAKLRELDPYNHEIK